MIKPKKTRGFSLVELMVVALIFYVAIFALWALFAACLGLIVQSKEIDVATKDISNVLENIKSLPFSSITTTFPAGAFVPGAYILKNETIKVTYPSVTTDLLQVQVEADWTGRDKQSHTQAFNTICYKGL